MAHLLDGTRIRDEIKEELKPRIAALPRPPGLSVLLAGDDPASEIYVRNKVKASHELGICGETIGRPATASTQELIEIVQALNERSNVDGILVQMPLPPQVDAKRVLLALDPAKDVDGFHPCNVGNLVTGRPGPRPCTPSGIIELLKRYQIPIAGQRAVVVGRSDIVGKPMAFLLLHENATVTICHSKTKDLADVCRAADILIAAIGRAALVTEDFIKPGATVIDVGMNRVSDETDARRILADAPERLEIFTRRGSVLLGDVHPVHAVRVAGAYTPVPGGVGPLTIAMLMMNTVQCAEERLKAC
jgi:methylenetetrahydrofolate dehydrogenase (NADP+)/methenyltetrahydrofolate cyclohydrolase